MRLIIAIAIAALVAGCSSSQQTETTTSAPTTVGSATTAPVATTSGTDRPHPRPSDI